MKQICWLLYKSTNCDWFRFKLESSAVVIIDSMCLSFNRSELRTNQNFCRTEFIISSQKVLSHQPLHFLQFLQTLQLRIMSKWCEDVVKRVEWLNFYISFIVVHMMQCLFWFDVLCPRFSLIQLNCAPW